MDHRFILASGSPRRKELLAKRGIEFEVIKSDSEELATQTDPSEMVKELSMQKARDVEGKLTYEDGSRDTLILAADTVVVSDGRVLGKPADEAEAVRMLSDLQGRKHEVYTGVTLLEIRAGSKEQARVVTCFSRCTTVELYPMTEEAIRAYVASGEPMDKAGSYAIQGDFFVNVKGIEGDYNNVVGLPMAALYQECLKAGIQI